MTEHTPTPWYVVRMRGWDGPVIGRRSQYEADLVSGDVPLAKMIDKASHWENSFPVEANAALIVKAVNNHEALVALAKAYEQWEADIILENKCWTGQNVQLTDALYERMIELQAERNRILADVGQAQVSGGDNG